MAEQVDSIISFGLASPVRILFPNLFEARKVKVNGKERGDAKFGATFLIPPDHPDWATIQAKAKAVAAAKWPGVEYKSIRRPFKDGDKEAEKSASKKKDGSFYKGMVVLKASTKYPVVCVDASHTPPVETVNKKLFYSGAFVAAEINFVANQVTDDETGEEKRYISAYLQGVCFVRDGSRIAGRDVAQSFKHVQGAKTADNPAAGAEDDDDEVL